MSVLVEQPAALTLEPRMRPESNLWRDAARRFRKNKLAVGALVVMVLLMLIAIFADLIAPYAYDYSVINEALQFPSRQHLLGTDAVGRDFLSRLIYGTRVSLVVGLSVQAIALMCGLTFGLLAGTLGGWVDYIVMRWVEVLTAIPIWLFALFLISVWRASDSAPGSGLLKVIVAIGLIGWVDICRLTRAQLLSLRQRDYVLAAEAIGATRLQIALRHMLPNALTPLIVGHAWRADGDLHRGRPQLSGLRHQRPAAELGQNGGRLQLLYSCLLASGPLPDFRDCDHYA